MRLILALASASLLASPAVAQDRIPPYPVPRLEPVFVTGLDLDLTVTGPAMRVTQRVTLTNRTSVDQEFDLIFPLGSGSVISGLELRLGETVLEGNV